MSPLREDTVVGAEQGLHEGLLIEMAHDVIARQVTQMTRLLDDLLDVSRITHGKLQLKRERVSLKRMIYFVPRQGIATWWHGGNNSAEQCGIHSRSPRMPCRGTSSGRRP